MALDSNLTTWLDLMMALMYIHDLTYRQSSKWRHEHLGGMAGKDCTCTRAWCIAGLVQDEMWRLDTYKSLRPCAVIETQHDKYETSILDICLDINKYKYSMTNMRLQFFSYAWCMCGRCCGWVPEKKPWKARLLVFLDETLHQHSRISSTTPRSYSW